jgi:3-oxoacyl-[acyl-carrier-protein] synthase III
MVSPALTRISGPRRDSRHEFLYDVHGAWCAARFWQRTWAEPRTRKGSTVMKPFVINRSGRLVFPSNFFPELDFTVFDTLDQFEAVIARDFETKAPTGSDILERIATGAYANRHELLRDLALNLLWVNRYAVTMYVKRPTRWRDVPRAREDVFLPVLTPWEEGERKVAAVEKAYWALPARWNAKTEDAIFDSLFYLFRYRRHHAVELPAIPPTVKEALSDPWNRTYHIQRHDPDYRVYSTQEIIDCAAEVPQLEALLRWAMVLHNQHPWDRAQSRLTPLGQLGDDDFVVLFHPRTPDVMDFIQRVRSGGRTRRPASASPEPRQPLKPYPAVEVRKRFAVMPRLESLAAVHGEHSCTNDDLIRNAAFNWSPMSADEIREKTGIEARRYTERGLDEISLQAAKAALEKAGRGPEEIGAVLFCSCTSSRLIPSVATWISGQLGIYQTHASVDLVAACAGLPYGLSEAVRLLQEVERPVLLVCGEKFSDKIGSVRTSRMIFGDGAAALVIGPTPADAEPDVEVLQSYASGPASEVNSIIWPNPEFDNNITVYGPEVKALAQRYLQQMISELERLPGPDGARRLLDAIDLVVPHQANKTMVMKMAAAVGLSADRLYFNIERVGNTSSASIPLAIHDAVRDGVIARPMRIFAPGFGAGAVGGYAVLRLDPAIVALEARASAEVQTPAPTAPTGPTSSNDMKEAFGE